MSTTHHLFAVVLWVVLGLGVLASIWAMATSGKEWEAYQNRGLDMDSVRTAARTPVSSSVAAAERESEIRQMVQAANDRRVRRGEAARDVEADTIRLLASADPGASANTPVGAPSPGTTGPGTAGAGPPISALPRDPEVESEVRALVNLRNQRRLRKGQAPLDVEAEIRRELDELAMLHVADHRMNTAPTQT